MVPSFSLLLFSESSVAAKEKPRQIKRNKENLMAAATDIWFFFWYLVWVFGRSDCAKFQIAFPCSKWVKKSFLRYCDNLRQWNKQIVVEHYRSVRQNNHEIVIISYRFKWFRGVNCFQTTCTLAPLFKVDYIYILIISLNNQAADGEFLHLYLKSVQENSV